VSGTTATARVRLESREGGVRVIRLADAAHRNAIDRGLRDELAQAVGAVAEDGAARVLVVTADGPDFCAGADLIDTFDNAAARPTEELRADLLRIYDSFLALRALTIPTIAAVRGQAIGAGANLAFSCDVRIAAPDAKFAIVFTKIGLHPGGGATYYLAKMLGRERALRVLLDGETLDAQAALAAGVVSQVAADAEGEAVALALRWAALDPDVARSIKRAVDIAIDEGFAPSVDFESLAQARSAQRPQIQEAVERLRARRQGRP
jgi:enoyl-CoA hydratase